MGVEQATVQQIAQMEQNGVNVVIKTSDLLFMMLEKDNSELKDWLDHGNAFDTVFVPKENGLEFYSRGLEQGIPMEKITLNEDTPLYRQFVKDATIKMRENGLSEEEIEKALDENKFTCFTIRDVDKTRALHLRDTIDREHNNEMALTPDRANQMFRDMDTSLFCGLKRYQADILQREFSENGVHSSLTYHKDSRSYEIEVATADLTRSFDNSMSRVEISVQDALIKMSHPEMIKFSAERAAVFQNIAAAIKSENRSVEEKKADHSYTEKVIYDSFNPENRIELKDGQAILFTNGKEENKIYDLKNNHDARELKHQIDRFNAPDLAELDEYEETRRLSLDYPDAFEKNGFGKRAEEVKKALALEGVINIACEKYRKENLIQTDLKNKRDYSGKVENLQREIRIDNSDKVKDIAVQLSLDPVEEKQGLDVTKGDRDWFEEWMQNVERNLAHMQIDFDGLHKDIEYKIYEDPEEMKDLGATSQISYKLNGAYIETDLDDYFNSEQETPLEIDLSQDDIETGADFGKGVEPENPYEDENIEIGEDWNGFDPAGQGMFDEEIDQDEDGYTFSDEDLFR